MVTEKIHLEDDEHILLQVRKHWFLLCVQVCGIFFSAILPLFLAYFFFRFVDVSFLGNQATGILIAFYAAWLIIMWMTLFSIWTNYYLDMWIVTNKRLIAIDQNGFFHRTVSSFRLERMQDIQVSVRGIIATFLGYGTLDIQTAGEEDHFKVFGLPDPADIKSVILESADSLLYDRKKPIDVGL